MSEEYLPIRYWGEFYRPAVTCFGRQVIDGKLQWAALSATLKAQLSAPA